MFDKYIKGIVPESPKITKMIPLYGQNLQLYNVGWKRERNVKLEVQQINIRKKFLAGNKGAQANG